VSDELIILISSIGAVQSYFLAIYILSFKGKINLPNLLLGCLFLAMATRVSKSLLWAFWADTPLWFINVGFASHAAVGPLFLLYAYHRIFDKSQFNKINLLQLLPAGLIIALSFQLSLSGFWYLGGYKFLLYHQLLYMIAGMAFLVYIQIRKKRKSITVDSSTLKWISNLWLGITVWGLGYFSNYVMGLTSYFLGPMLYSAIIYLLSFYALRHQEVFRKKRGKYKNLNLSAEDIQRYKGKLLKLFECEKPYLDSEFTLSMLSEKISIPNHILSHIFNDEIKVNFSEFINSYRIEDARNMLQDPTQKHLKISSIAFECGFNSLSSFNTAFKKVVSKTPSDFRDNQPASR